MIIAEHAHTRHEMPHRKPPAKEQHDHYETNDERDEVSNAKTAITDNNRRRLTFIVVVSDMGSYSAGSSSESSLNSTPILSIRSASMVLVVRTILRLS